jgi:fatty-acyl-CoA synthase
VAIAALKRGIDIHCGYGMSEGGPTIALHHLTEAEHNLDIEKKASLLVRAGRPIGLVDLKVVGPHGVVPNDDKTTGEVVVRSPWFTQGYLKDASNSEKLWEDGWMHTQDVACRDKGGRIRITDRIKDVIKVGGEWISSLEIEDIICLHPGVAEAAIIGKPHTSWGEVPLALVVQKPGETVKERELIKHVKKYIDLGMLPREVILLEVKFVPELIRTSAHKINKLELRKKYLPQ